MMIGLKHTFQRKTSFGIISFQNKESTDVEKDDQDFSIAN